MSNGSMHALLKGSGNSTAATDRILDAKCIKVGGFMHKLARSHADGIYWTLFVLVIVLLVVSSYVYDKDKEAQRQDAEKRKLEWKYEQDAVIDPECRRIHTTALRVSGLSFVLGIVLLVLQAYAGLTIHYCHKEDLISFYWSFFSLIQIGSVIAIFGIFINECYMYSGQKLPAWNTALATPILVLLSVFDLMRKTVKRKMLARRSKTELSLPTSGVIRVPIVGCQIGDDPNIQFLPRDHVPPGATIFVLLDPLTHPYTVPLLSPSSDPPAAPASQVSWSSRTGKANASTRGRNSLETQISVENRA